MTDPFARLADRANPVHDPDPEQAARIEERMRRAFTNPEVTDAQEIAWMPDRTDRDGPRAAQRWLTLVASMVLIVAGFAVWTTAGRSSDDETPAASNTETATSLPLATSASAPATVPPDAPDWIRLEPGTTWDFSQIIDTPEFATSQPIGLVVDSVGPATTDGLEIASARFRSDAGDPIVLGATTLIVDPGNAQLAFPAVFLDPTLDLLSCRSPVVAVQATAVGDIDASAWPIDDSDIDGVCPVVVTTVTVAPQSTVRLPSLDEPIELVAVPVTIEWQFDGAARTTTWWISEDAPVDGLIAIDLDADNSAIDIVRSGLISDS